MSTAATIERISILDLRELAGPGDDYLFVGVHGGGRTGWYGPVSALVARCASALTDAACERAITDHPALHRALRVAVADRRDATGSWAIGAVDCAAWDLHAQLAGVPVARLLAPSADDRVALYASWLRLDLTNGHAAADVDKVGQDGWLFTKWGLRRAPGCGAEAEADRLSAGVDLAVSTLGRAAAFDALSTWDLRLARRFAARVDVSMLHWLEDPLGGLDTPGHQELAARLPLALGERMLVGDDPAAMLALRPAAFTLDVIGCGGLTRAVELITAAHTAAIPAFAHGRSLLPALHLAAAFPHAMPAVEYQLQWMPRRQLLYASPRQPIQGHIQLTDAPGLGATPRK
ncbi:MAG: enolase C-terminal domain-like protein [Pseudonocardiaceae bacterium]